MKYKKNFQTLKKILTAKISEKKNFTRFQREHLQQKQQYKNFYFIFCVCMFPIYKRGLDIKMSLITVEGYKNAKVHTIKVKNDLWVNTKDVGNGLGVKTYMTQF